MSFQAAYWASSIPANGDVGNAALRTLTVLGLHADDDGHAYPKVKRIAAERSAVPSTIKRHLHELEDAELIQRVNDSPLVSRIPINHRPIVWRLALDMFEGSQVATPSDLGGSQVEHLEGSQGEHLGVATAANTEKELKTVESHGKDTPAMPSEAFEELGGQASPPVDPTPEQIAARRYPKQCAKHQSQFNGGDTFDPCSGCKAAADEWPDIQLKASQAKRAREVEAQKEEARARLRAAQGCPWCNGTGLMDGTRNCRNCDPEWVASCGPGEGLAIAKAALQEAS